MVTDRSHSQPLDRTWRMIGLAPFFAVLLAIASCATMVTHEKAVDSLRNSRICCESMAQFEYAPMSEGEGASFALDESSSAFGFTTGKSYFKAFRLPVRKLPYRIRIRSFALGEHIDKAHIFYPQVAVLDDRFAMVGQSTSGDFLLSKTGLKKEAAGETWGLPVKLEGNLLVNDPSARYLLVYTTGQLLSGSSPYETQRAVPIFAPGMVTALPGGKDTIFIKHSPFGLLHVEIVPAETATPESQPRR